MILILIRNTVAAAAATACITSTTDKDIAAAVTAPGTTIATEDRRETRTKIHSGYFFRRPRRHIIEEDG